MPSAAILRRLPSPNSVKSLTTLPVAGKPYSNSIPAAHYDDLIATAGRSRDFGRLHYLLNKRARENFFNTGNTFKFITNTEESLAALSDIGKTLARLDAGWTRLSAFESLVGRLCKLGRIREALDVIDMMARGEYGLRAISFHPVLNCLTRKREMEEARRVMGIMGEYGVKPDITAFNFLLTAYCFCGDLTDAAEVMKKIEEEGLGADERTYDALVLGACRAGKVEGALMVLRRMEDEKIEALYSTHAHILNALLKLGCFAQAVKFVLIYGGRKKALDSQNFGLLARKLIRLKRFDEANLVLEEMEKRTLVMGDELRNYYNHNVKNVLFSDN